MSVAYNAVTGNPLTPVHQGVEPAFATMPDTKRILIVDDEQKIISLLEQSVRSLGFELETACDGEQGLLLAESRDYDLIVLDVGLPTLSGFEVCKRLRAKGNRTPILMLTGRTEEIDKVLGLELGADDYVEKPFSVREVEARISALLRRAAYLAEDRAESSTKPLVFGPLVIDTAKRFVSLNGHPVQLTALEYRMLVYFASQPGVTIPRERLLQDIWGYEIANYSSTVTAHMSRLRMKIEPNPQDPIFVRTVHGVGYCFAEKDAFGES